ncbi:hypothetical protein [Acidovorax sp. sic0104]|uniref:hypothetical protein n=1 Tax=Acidovorax sp. sic0104 TaxID=2854784 RepID=UPI002104E705|nr:hypothetical protein [Acidovorax sp. sic0104]
MQQISPSTAASGQELIFIGAIRSDMKKRPDEKLSGELARFMRLYARKSQRGVEPNDRRYDHKLEKLMKRLNPGQLSQLLHDEETTEVNTPQSTKNDQ